jgi:hypothetical protein
VQDAEVQVLHMKREVQAAREALTFATAQCAAAKSEQQEAKSKVEFFQHHVLGTEQISKDKMLEDIASLKERLNNILSEIGVFRSLHEEIRWSRR